MKVVLTIDGDQCVIHDPDTSYDRPTLTEWIDQARRALAADNEMHLLADTELAADEAGDDDEDETVGFRGRRR